MFAILEKILTSFVCTNKVGKNIKITKMMGKIKQVWFMLNKIFMLQKICTYQALIIIV